ncbi:MAG: 4Fe-4S dicluster domain-containing protein [Bacilli bacterium]
MVKGKVTFDESKCKGCGLCVAFCPVKILALDPRRMNQHGYQLITVTEPEKCIGCAFCAIMCPDSVITVERNTHE